MCALTWVRMWVEVPVEAGGTGSPGAGGGHVLVISLLYIKIEGRDRILPGSPRSACLVYTAVNSKTPCLQ